MVLAQSAWCDMFLKVMVRNTSHARNIWAVGQEEHENVGCAHFYNKPSVTPAPGYLTRDGSARKSLRD